MDSPTDPLPEQPPSGNGTNTDTCLSEQTYTTEEGDDCDSIALANSVSGANLYYYNPSLHNCSSIPAGLELCLPEQCETYTVQEGESCVGVGHEAGASWQRLVDWNMMLNSRCTNLWSNNPFWGRVICVSPPGGAFEDSGGGGGGGNVGDNTGGEGGSGNGYAEDIVDPPEGDDSVAEGTTLRCGEFIEAQDGVGCGSMLSTAAVPMGLFLAVNPSLGTALECSDNLETGMWYCLRPVRGWNAATSALE